MKIALERYVQKFDNIKIYFITFKNMDNDYIIEKNVIYMNGKESYMPGILDKTIKAIKLLFNETFNYVIRGNISTVINLKKLCNILEQEKRTNIYAGGYFLTLSWIDKPFGIVNNKYHGTKYVGGTSIIFDKISIKYLIDNSDKLDYSIIDDVAIGILLRNNIGMNYITYPGFYFNHVNVNYADILYYRNRTDCNRMIDVNKMNEFIDYLLEN